MPVPWLQIVQLVPSILEVSRELLSKTRRQPIEDVPARLTMLEENERRQAELIHQMADQISGMTRAITALRRRVMWLTAGCAAVGLVAIFALARGSV